MSQVENKLTDHLILVHDHPIIGPVKIYSTRAESVDTDNEKRSKTTNLCTNLMKIGIQFRID